MNLSTMTPRGYLESRRRSAGSDRRGTTMVEFAIILPVFGLLMLGILEFGHIYMVYNTMTAAAKRAARYGAVEGITKAQVETRVDEILGAAIDISNATVIVKNAAEYDDPDVDLNNIDFNDDTQFPDAVLVKPQNPGPGYVEPNGLFLLQITVPYTDVAILPPMWARNLNLTALAVMRHE